MQSLPDELYQKIIRLYFRNTISEEIKWKVSNTLEKNFSKYRCKIVAERGAFIGRSFACKNCEHFGFPCLTCFNSVFNKHLHNMKPYMYTIMQRPSDEISCFRKYTIGC